QPLKGDVARAGDVTRGVLLVVAHVYDLGVAPLDPRGGVGRRELARGRRRLGGLGLRHPRQISARILARHPASHRWERLMQLEGIHHITAITGDAPRNVDFYARVMGLRLVKKTVNQDDPTIYHLFYGDEGGDPGLDLTFFEYPG